MKYPPIVTLSLITLASGALLSCTPTNLSNKDFAASFNSRQEAIVGGTVEAGYEAVGALGYNWWGFDHFCTGTLIAPRWVLTAAHCLVQDGWEISPEDIGFFIGTYANDASSEDIISCAAFHVHEAYNPGDPETGIPPEHDIALVELTGDVDVTPIPYNSEPLIDSEGESITWVGFGVSRPPHDGSGTKRLGVGYLDEVFWWYLIYDFDGQLPCSGDSGGPTLMELGPEGEMRVAGVISTADENCELGGTSTRVDGYAPWIEAVMAGRHFEVNCDLTGEDCPDGFACLPNMDGSGICWLSEQRGLGADCDPNWDTWDIAPCDDGLICAPYDGGECLPMCFQDSDCEENSCEIPLYSNVDDLGICRPCQDIDRDGYCVEVDCDDTDERAYPGGVEVCNDLVDNDCDGDLDDEDEDCGCVDADDDGVCAIDDCDDNQASRSPNLEEDCDDDIDNDCNGAVDDDDPHCAGSADGGPDAGPEEDGGSDGSPDDVSSNDAGCQCSLGLSGSTRNFFGPLLAALWL